jgi:2-succinyl-5-enolpyruvyl-6-hydroxy-3-cyclohexene-1-carboxylate synthase
VNPATAFASVLVDELARCGLREAVLAPGSRSAPLAMALWERAQHPPGDAPGEAGDEAAEAGDDAAEAGGIRLHVRIDERSAAFLALGLAKASGRPVAVLCTSGTAAAHFHAAVIEADESGVPLIVLTADRPPELRGTGANQTIDQLKLYGTAVRWFCEAGVPEERPGQVAYWRSLACRAWACASGALGGFPGPVHVNVPLREPLVPDLAPAGGSPGAAGAGWPEPLDGRPGGAPWTAIAAGSPAGSRAGMVIPAGRAQDETATRSTSYPPGPEPLDVRSTGALALDLPWTERGVLVCGDGGYDAAPLLRLAEEAGWPVLAEPSSGARRGPNALSAYQYLLDAPEFLAGHRPDLIVSAGRPGLSRGQAAFLGGPSGDRRPAAGGAEAGPAPRHVVVAQGPGRWADPARSATDVAASIRLVRAPEPGSPAGSWLSSWLAADAAARLAADAVLGADGALTEPRLARDLAAALPSGSLLWVASSLPVRDLDHHLAPRSGLRVLASRGASGIDGLVSAAIGAALAHQRAGGGRAAALLGDLAILHDAAGLFLGPDEPSPDLAIVVINNDGGGIFSALEQAAFPGPFERVFGTPHHARLGHLAAAAGIPHSLLAQAAELPAALRGRGLRIIEVAADRAAGTALRARLRNAASSGLHQCLAGKETRPEG